MTVTLSGYWWGATFTCLGDWKSHKQVPILLTPVVMTPGGIVSLSCLFESSTDCVNPGSYGRGRGVTNKQWERMDP